MNLKWLYHRGLSIVLNPRFRQQKRVWQGRSMYDSAAWTSTSIQSTINRLTYIHLSGNRRCIYEKRKKESCLIRISLNRLPWGSIAFADWSQESAMVNGGGFHGAIFEWNRVSMVQRSITIFSTKSWSLVAMGLMSQVSIAEAKHSAYGDSAPGLFWHLRWTLVGHVCQRASKLELAAQPYTIDP